MDDLVTSPELCRLAGVSYRQLDYWCQQGIMQPRTADRRVAVGSGNPRGWTLDEVAVARVCGQMAKLRAPTPVIAAVVRSLEAVPGLWAGSVTVDVDRNVKPGRTSGDGWQVDLAACREWVGAVPLAWPGVPVNEQRAVAG